jgi:signal transduction histidine kinase
VVNVPVSEAYSVSRGIAQNLVVIVGVAILGLGLLGVTLVRRTVRDLDRLTSKAARLEQGGLDIDLGSDRTDELGQLYAQFASMRDRIDQRIAEAEAARGAAQEAKAKLEERNESLRSQRTIITVLNRVLRHNIRNGLTVLEGHLDLLASEPDGDDRQLHIEKMFETMANIEGTAEKARAIEQLVDTETEVRDRVDVSALLETEIAQFEQLYPDAAIETAIEQGVTARAHESIRFVFTNVLENAIEHNDRQPPRLEVSLASDATADAVVVTIADNGPGIPEAELQTLEAESETPTEHASGLGLWIVTWIVSKIDGDIAFADRDPTGTVVTITLEAATDDE